ncbi:MAG: response regulator transcription factor, partial [Actinomycetes bacterium]
AQARFDLATVLAGAGDRHAALAAAEQAARTANRLGMAPLRTATKQLLDELRVNTRTLTPRQREVAELVAHGRTNREIAAELHIAQRTAENHVKDIMTALDLRNRSQIAVWATHNEAGTTSNPIR